jgi:putative membrane protein
MSSDAPSQPPAHPPLPTRPTPRLLARAAIGGVFMGLANLVPGISGGTMLVAAGVYRAFITAVSDVSRLRFSKSALLLLAVVVVAAVSAIGLFAGAISYGLVHHRWAMYAAFIGLTLGGAPLLVRLTRPFSTGAWIGLVVGVASMLAVVALQSGTANPASVKHGLFYSFLAGVAGASAMILPGISGAYLLLLLGMYETVINAIKDFGSALTKGDLAGMTATFGVLVPVGVGVVVGIAGVSSLLKWLIARYEKATLGVLLGLLLGAPAGLYPFKEGVPPKVGDTIKGELVTDANLADLADPKNAKEWTEVRFSPTPAQIGGAVGIALAGFAFTLLIARLAGPEADEGK